MGGDHPFQKHGLRDAEGLHRSRGWDIDTREMTDDLEAVAAQAAAILIGEVRQHG